MLIGSVAVAVSGIERTAVSRCPDAMMAGVANDGAADRRLPALVPHRVADDLGRGAGGAVPESSYRRGGVVVTRVSARLPMGGCADEMVLAGRTAGTTARPRKGLLHAGGAQPVHTRNMLPFGSSRFPGLDAPMTLGLRIRGSQVRILPGAPFPRSGGLRRGTLSVR
jgi:hypothetical protein